MSVIKVTDLAFVRVRAPDLDKARAFFKDFGFIETEGEGGRLAFRGLGPEREIVAVEPAESSGLAAIGFAVAEREDLDRFAAAAGGTVSERSGPGGGWQAIASDPDGNRLELVWGIEPLEPISVERQVMNDSRDRHRRRGDLFRPPVGPSHILRLGHVVLTTPQPLPLAAWYRETLGLLVSDEVYAGSEDNVILSFNRIDRGEEYVDHHVFQTLNGPAGGIHHISFEVLDLDDLQVGSEYLTDKGYRHMWGIGRHKQGSQIFDYWIDPFGIMYEHWTDTDMLNATSAPGKLSVEESAGPWGPPVPPEFLTQVG